MGTPNKQMEEVIKQLKGHGYKVIEEYNDTGQLSKISGETPVRKTWWDWLQLLIIPFVLLVIGSFFTYLQNQASLQVSEHQNQANLNQRRIEFQIATDQQRETTLKTTMDDIKDLLLNRGLQTSKCGDEVRAVARAEIIAAVGQLDGARKGLLIRFLSEAGLLTGIKENQIISLNGAELGGADLRGANLDNADLSYADISEADLRGTFLRGANLSYADLRGANWQYASLDNADLSGATVTTEQLKQAKSLKGTIMPDSPFTKIQVGGCAGKH